MPRGIGRVVRPPRLMLPCITAHTNELGAVRDPAESDMGPSVFVTEMMHGRITRLRRFDPAAPGRSLERQGASGA